MKTQTQINREKREQHALRNGFKNWNEYARSTPAYKAKIKNQGNREVNAYSSKPSNTIQHPIFTDYHIDKNGGIWKFSIKRQTWLNIKVQTNKGKYLTTQLYIGKKRHMVYHHTVVCEAFNGLRPGNDYQVDHIDCDTTNNHPSNLRWLTQTENIRRRWKN